MKHAWIVAGLVLVGGCGQTGSLYLPEDDTQSPIVIRPVTEPATAPSPAVPSESPAASTPPVTGTTGPGAPPEGRDGKATGSPPAKTAP